MLTEVSAGPYTVRGISVGGVHAALQARAPENLRDRLRIFVPTSGRW
jgi:hypothetical protein